MSFDDGLHLSEDQLALAVVDEGDLPSSSRGHLATCSRCRSEKVRCERDLMRIGRLAEQVAPLPKQRILIPEPEPRGVFHWHWRAVLGIALSMAMLMIVIRWPGPTGSISEQGAEPALVEIQEAETMMIEVSMLAENALPRVYMEIIGEPNTGESYSDLFWG
ncbi:MAG: hypothetical protein ABII68_02625 [Pseudomonadota bacterium]